MRPKLHSGWQPKNITKNRDSMQAEDCEMSSLDIPFDSFQLLPQGFKILNSPLIDFRRIVNHTHPLCTHSFHCPQGLLLPGSEVLFFSLCTISRVSERASYSSKCGLSTLYSTQKSLLYTFDDASSTVAVEHRAPSTYQSTDDTCPAHVPRSTIIESIVLHGRLDGDEN